MNPTVRSNVIAGRVKKELVDIPVSIRVKVENARKVFDALFRNGEMSAANREQLEPVLLKLESSLPTLRTRHQVEWADHDWTTDPLEWEKAEKSLRKAELKSEKALREERLEEMAKKPRLAQPSPDFGSKTSKPTPKYDLSDEFRAELFRNWTLLMSDFQSPVGMTSEPKLRKGFPSTERMDPFDSSFESAAETLQWLTDTHFLLERELSNSAAGRKILELLVEERDRIRSIILSQPSGRAAEKSSPQEAK